MARVRLAVCGAALVLALAAVVTASPWANPPETELTGAALTVQQNVLALSLAWDSPSDCTDVASYFTPNATWRADGAAPVYGRAAVTAACTTSAAANAFQYDGMLETGYHEESGMAVWRWSFVVAAVSAQPAIDIHVLSRAYTDPNDPQGLLADVLDAFTKQVLVANTQVVTLIPPSPQCANWIAAYRAMSAAYGVGNCTQYSAHFIADPSAGSSAGEAAVLRVGRDAELSGRVAIQSACQADARGASSSWRQIEEIACVEYARTLVVAWKWYFAVSDGTATPPKPSYAQYISEVVFEEGDGLVARETAAFTQRLLVGSVLPGASERECAEGVHSSWYIVLGVCGSVALFGLGLLQMWCCMRSRMSAAAGGHGHAHLTSGAHASHNYEPPTHAGLESH